MKLPRRTFLHLAAGAAALPVISGVAQAQAYPARPVRVIVGFTPGSGPDIIARLIGQWLSERLGQQFLVENRPGAGSNIGTDVVVRAPADGYTLLLVGAPNAINTTLYDKLGFDFLRDIAPVAGITRGGQVIADLVAGQVQVAFLGFRDDRAHQERQGACARDNRRDPLGCAAGHPDRGRVRAGL
jgi:tripartite-type tricarboxylate transporter receptor subunit TctC